MCVYPDSSGGKKLKPPAGRNPAEKVPHLRSRVTLSVMTDDLSLDRYAIPAELYSYISNRIESKTMSYLPIALIDKISHRLRDLKVSLVDLSVASHTKEIRSFFP